MKATSTSFPGPWDSQSDFYLHWNRTDPAHSSLCLTQPDKRRRNLGSFGFWIMGQMSLYNKRGHVPSHPLPQNSQGLRKEKTKGKKKKWSYYSMINWTELEFFTLKMIKNQRAYLSHLSLGYSLKSSTFNSVLDLLFDSLLILFPAWKPTIRSILGDFSQFLLVE